MGKATPMMKQYLELKEQNKESILFFRLGDFYEMFFDDAILASRELEITLTGRDCGLKERAPMCGVPYHSADAYISRLIDKGYKVAICEQVEDPKESKGIVKREVVRTITPGTVVDPDMLNDRTNNYIMIVVENDSGIGIAYGDITTGELNCTEFVNNRCKMTIDEINKIVPSEIVVRTNGNYSEELIDAISSFNNTVITRFRDNSFIYNNARDMIKEHFKVYSLDSLGLRERDLATIAVGVFLDYINETQKVSLVHINSLNIYSPQNYMLLDKYTRRNLELVETMRSKDKKGSLLWTIDKSTTSMGARMLRKWIEEPLTDTEQINMRLESVEILLNDMLLREDLKELFKEIYDLERLSSKIVYGNVNARDLIALKSSIGVIPKIKSKIANSESIILKEINSKLDSLENVFELLDSSIIDDPPISIKDGGIIKATYNKELQELRRAINEGKTWILNLEESERKKTGIKNLKIGFNKVFGYYLEITKSNIKNAPKDYIRKQTLANAERYITPELKEIENKILGAEERIVDLEYKLFIEVRIKILENVKRIINTAKAVAELDVIVSFAEASYMYGYNKPIVNNSNVIELKDSRHPVVERVSGDELFVPNDALLDNDIDRFYIITGPNMAGKSTYLRQVALNVLMAQIGCFVPASKATIGVVDRIFTRVGASDDLSQGQSTFMVEMSELSNILHNATSNSLIILDEIGRGTSTYDGLSIAWSVVEYISNSNVIGAKTLFATHYHELTELEGQIKGVKNYSISVKESGDDIVFLRKIIRGGADQSYGIQVAKLAGLPQNVIKRAQEILLELESNDINKRNNEVACDIIMDSKENISEDYQVNLFNYKYMDIIDELNNIDIINLTPMDAMNKLYKLVNKVREL